MNHIVERRIRAEFGFGLFNSCLEELLRLKSDSISEKDRTYFSSYLQRLPGLYYDVMKGDTIVKRQNRLLNIKMWSVRNFIHFFRLTDMISIVIKFSCLRTLGSMGVSLKIW